MTAARTLPEGVSRADALAAALEHVQKVLCSFTMNESERLNSVASIVHHALLDFGGGYETAAIAKRERDHKAVAHARY